MKKYFLFDSGDYWYDIYEKNPAKVKCNECKERNFSIYTGVTYRPNGDISWVYIGSSCANCKHESYQVDWKIDYSPTTELENILFVEENYPKKEKRELNLLLNDTDYLSLYKHLDEICINGTLIPFYFYVGKGQVYLFKWSEDEEQVKVTQLLEWIKVHLTKWGSQRSFASDSLI
jgi:hypothetical protein